MREIVLIGVPVACALTATAIGVAACVVAGRADDALESSRDVTPFCVGVPEAGQAGCSRTTVPSARHLHAVPAVYSDGSSYDQQALNMDVLADALAASAEESAASGHAPDAA